MARDEVLANLLVALDACSLPDLVQLAEVTWRARQHLELTRTGQQDDLHG